MIASSVRVGIEGGGLRDFFVQQQRGGLKQRVRSKTPLHRAIQQHIGQGQQAHALVVRHPRLDQGIRLAARQAGAAVVDRFVKAEARQEAFCRQPLQVGARLLRRHHQRQRRGIWRNHQVVCQAALQAHAGHAEGSVLIIQAGVEGVVAGFRDAPRHAALLAVFDLTRDCRPVGLVQQGALESRHDQERHQVFEHRAAPRQQQRSAAHRGQLPSQRKPAFLWQLALCDGDKAGQARFGCQQIVEAVVAPAFADVVADGQQVIAAVVQEFIIHPGHGSGLPRQLLDGGDPLARMLAGHRQQGLQRLRFHAFGDGDLGVVDWLRPGRWHRPRE